MAKVSVVTVVYNGEDTIKETIESILAQTFADFEYLIVDNGSTDGSLKIIEAFKDPRIKLLKIPKNTGSPVAGRNLAIQHAEGKWIGFCDADDLWKKEKLEKQMAVTKSTRTDKVGIIFSAAEIINDQGKKLKTRKAPFEGFLPPKEAFKLMVLGDYITACSALFPKEVIKEVGELNESLAGTDEYELWLRITKSFGVFAIAEPLCCWRKRENNFSKNKKDQYLKTEKILEGLDDSLEVRQGKGKNLLRIIEASILERDFNVAALARKKLLGLPLSLKGRILLSVYDLSPAFANLIFKILVFVGIISL
jgi:glycosyltransferase involved in cell wall biosynthesis